MIEGKNKKTSLNLKFKMAKKVLDFNIRGN